MSQTLLCYMLPLRPPLLQDGGLNNKLVSFYYEFKVL